MLFLIVRLILIMIDITAWVYLTMHNEYETPNKLLIIRMLSPCAEIFVYQWKGKKGYSFRISLLQFLPSHGGHFLRNLQHGGGGKEEEEEESLKVILP